MKKYSTIYRFVGALLVAGATCIGCSKETASLEKVDITEEQAEEQIQNPEQDQDAPVVFKFSVDASTLNTKALTDPNDGTGTITVTWEVGDSVSVENLTSKYPVKGMLYAQSAGANTVLEGILEGNFNVGDELLLTFVSLPASGLNEQTGALNSDDPTAITVENSFDYATATVSIKEIALDPNVITTGAAAFERQQAIVKFSLENRKATPEAIKVTSLDVVIGDSTDTIKVVPAAATAELYVAMPAVAAEKVTLLAEGEDGFAYKLISPEQTYDNGMFYTRTVQMKRLATVKAPTATTAAGTNLAYNASDQALVVAAHIVWEVAGVETVLDDDMDKDDQKCVLSYFVKQEETAGVVPTAPLATENGWLTTVPEKLHAGTYYVWTKMDGNYDYEDIDVCEEPVKIVIDKADADIDVSGNGTLTYTGDAQNLISAAAKLKIDTTDVTSNTDADGAACEIQYYVSDIVAGTQGGTWATAVPTATNAGTYYVWVKVTGNGDINDISETLEVTQEIAKADITNVTAPTALNPSFTGNTLALIAPGTAVGGTMKYKLGADGSWSTVVPAATKIGSYTIQYKVFGDDNHNDTAVTSIVSSITKPAGFVTLNKSSLSWLYPDAAAKTVSVTSNHGGSLSVSTNRPDLFDVSISGTTITVFPKNIGAGKLIVTCAETADYAAATAEISMSLILPS